MTRLVAINFTFLKVTIIANRHIFAMSVYGILFPICFGICEIVTFGYTELT